MDKKTNEMSEEEIVMTGEDNVDEPQIIEEEETQKDKLKKLKAKLKTCEEEKNQHLEELQRTKADFLNSRRRLEGQAEINKTRILNDFLESLLPLCDSFDMAMADTKSWQAIDENWRKGVEGIKSQLNSILKKYNVTEMDVLGKHFDPEKHEAMSTIEADSESEIVMEVIQKGYERNGQVVRTAKVIISN